MDAIHTRSDSCNARIDAHPARACAAILLLLAAAGYWQIAEAAIYKCLIDGRVTYQSDPCPSGKIQKRPTVDELNAARKKNAQPAVPSTAPLPSAEKIPLPLAKASPRPVFACDGRTRCGQMTSCAEAKYFLASCPNTEMDGDHDGIPCEQQWCQAP